MSAAEAALLHDLPAVAFGFVMLLARFGALLMVVPGLGEAQSPAMLRAGLAACLGLLMLPVLGGAMPAMPATTMRLGAMLAAELATGLWLGWLARLVALALPAAAQFVSFMIGVSNVIVPDTVNGSGQTGALSHLFAMIPALLVLGSGLYMVPVSALAASYRLIPPGAILPVGDAATAMLHGVAASFALAARLASPFILAGTVWQITLGLIARMVPSLQVYQLALPGQVLGGMLLLALTAPILLAAWLDAARAGVAPL